MKWNLNRSLNLTREIRWHQENLKMILSSFLGKLCWSISQNQDVWSVIWIFWWIFTFYLRKVESRTKKLLRSYYCFNSRMLCWRHYCFLWILLQKIELLSQFSLRINQKPILAFVTGLITYEARPKTEAKITNQLGPGLKRLIKLTKETFAESGLTVLSTLC